MSLDQATIYLDIARLEGTTQDKVVEVMGEELLHSYQWATRTEEMNALTRQYRKNQTPYDQRLYENADHVVARDIADQYIYLRNNNKLDNPSIVIGQTQP
jgi:hypothetical protein